MNITLNPDSKDPIWTLFGKVIKLIDSKNFQQELARNGLQIIERYQTMLKIVLLPSYFYFRIVTCLFWGKKPGKAQEILKYWRPVNFKTGESWLFTKKRTKNIGIGIENIE